MFNTVEKISKVDMELLVYDAYFINSSSNFLLLLMLSGSFYFRNVINCKQ